MKFFVILLLFISILFANSNSLIEQKKASKIEKKDTLVEENFNEFDDFENEFSENDKLTEEVFDPLYSYNNWMTGVNDYLMINIVEPQAKVYRWVIPEGGRTSVLNAFKNLYFPVNFANNILQTKVENAGNETSRFLLNSTIGILGLFDVADSWFGIKPHVEDFGQTLGYYGAGSGFPVVLPFFGQRNVRDLFGTFADSYIDPIYYNDWRFYNTAEPYWHSVLLKGYEDFNEYSLTPEAYEKLTADSIDLYPFLRDAYEQYRNQLIKE